MTAAGLCFIYGVQVAPPLCFDHGLSIFDYRRVKICHPIKHCLKLKPTERNHISNMCNIQVQNIHTGTKHTGKIHTGTLYTGTINIGIIFMFKPLIGPILKVLI